MSRKFSSFDYRVTNPRIKNVLKSRAYLDNTVQLAMPFVKATSTVKIDEYLGEGNIGMSLGLHVINEDVWWENIYFETDNGSGYPLVGYTHTPDGSPKRIYAQPPKGDLSKLLQFFDQGSGKVTTSKFPTNPPPGITQMKIIRNKNGLLARGELSFSVPSLAQLEVLSRTFVIPGCGMILEWGQQFAPDVIKLFTDIDDPQNVEFDSTEINKSHMFPWHDRTRLLDMMDRLSKRRVGLEEILNDYVYPSHGQYMWMYGRVKKFSTKTNSDGSFDCSVEIFGPSEDTWAYSTTTTITPSVTRDNKFCEAGSIARFFGETTNGHNLKTLLDGVYNKTILPGWYGHVQYRKEGNFAEGFTPNATDASNLGQLNFADSKDAYFMSWRFFVNVVINNPKYGLKKLFADELNADQLLKVPLLRPYADGPNQTPITDEEGYKYLDDPLEAYVGRNKHLRSIDPSVLVIVHEAAVKAAYEDYSRKYPNWVTKELGQEALPAEAEGEGTLASAMLLKGDFELSAERAIASLSAEEKSLISDEKGPDRGFLSSGVWLNHKAVATSMVGADTFINGVTSLLQQMNSATRGFWQLALDTVDPLPPTPGVTLQSDNNHTTGPVDRNWKANSQNAVDVALGTTNDQDAALYVFNKYTRKDKITGKLIGSELTECTVDMSLPHRVFAQIAALGLVQKDDIPLSGVVEAGPFDGKAPVVSEPQESLRHMYALITLTPSTVEGTGHDLTNIPGQYSPGQCGQSNTSTTAQTSGPGQMVSQADVEQIKTAAENKSADDLTEDITDANEKLKSDLCSKECPELVKTLPPPTISPSSTTLLAGSPLQNTSNVTSGFGQRNDPNKPGTKQQHKGVDIGVPPGTPVFAANAGTIRVNAQGPAPHNEVGYGVWVQILGDDGIETRYAHLSETLVKNGDKVVAGQRIGISGGEKRAPGAGSSTGPHLHFEVLQGGQQVDPRPLLQAVSQPPSTPPQPPANREGSEVVEEFKKSVAIQSKCRPCAIAAQRREQAQKVLPARTAVDKITRRFPNLRSIWRYIEPFPEDMVARIRGEADSNRSNAFGVAPAQLSLTANLVLPGISGLRVGELFWIDRIPAFYRIFGAFQILELHETIGVEGWQTRILARFNFLGGIWKNRVQDRLRAIAGGNG